MKRNFLIKAIVCLFTVVAFCSCKDDEKIPEPEKSTECNIMSFSVDDVPWTVGTTSITHTYPAGTEKTALTPNITVSEGATISPASGTTHNFFTETVRYTVTAEDGLTRKNYTVNARVENSTSCDIVRFTVNDVEWDINIETDSITYLYPPDMAASTFAPVITLSPGATVTPGSGVEQDFFTANGIRYTVTAEDGVTKKNYIAKARISNNCEIESFSVNGIDWQINGTDITYSYRRKPSSPTLTPTIILSPGATMDKPADEPQDFFTAEGVTYTVTAEDGITSKIYTVKAVVENIASGTTGECTWAIVDEEIGYILTISGNGAMADYGRGKPMAPWDQYNSNIAKVFIEEGVTYIGDYICPGSEDPNDPIKYYDKLTSVTISNSVKTIGYAAFAWCRNITSVTIGNSMEILGDYAFHDCNKLGPIIIPNSVTHIGLGTFNYCYGLTSITIGSGVTSIGMYAFGSALVTEVINLNPTPPETDGLAFGNASIGTATLRVPAGSVSAYGTAPVWGLFRNIVGI
jgi:hypothetical protein